MIEIRYLQAESGANRFGTCNCCGKSSGEDPLMISVKFSYYGHGTLICLCDDCKKKLTEALPPANNSETPNSSDTISRAKAIDALKKDMASLDHIIKGMSDNDVRLDAYVSQRNQVNYDIYTISNLPPAQPAIDKIKAYEDKQKDHIEVGDIVERYVDGKLDSKGIYLQEEGGYWRCLFDTGAVLMTFAYPKGQFKKTGKHYDIQSILEAMRK